MSLVYYSGTEDCLPSKSRKLKQAGLNVIRFAVEDENLGSSAKGNPSKTYHKSKAPIITKISCSKRCTALLDDLGRIWTFGQTISAGHPVRTDYPEEIYNPLPINNVVCGDNCLMFQTDDNRVYSWGESSYFRLGIKEGFVSKPTEIKPTVFKQALVDSHEEINQKEKGAPRKSEIIDTEALRVEYNIQHIAIDRCRTYFIINGSLFILGREIPKSPTEELKNMNINHVPKLLGMGISLRGLHVGQFHVLAWDLLGHLYSWGESKDEKLGHHLESRTPTILDTPKRISSLLEHKIIMASCGDRYSLALNSKGVIYVWGHHFEKEDPNSKVYKYQELLKPKPLQPTGALTPNVTIMKIVSYANHNAAIDREGDLYTWGENIHGCLMQTLSSVLQTPTRVSFEHPFKILDVGCGENFTVVVFAKNWSDIKQHYEDFRNAGLHTIKKAVNLYSEYTSIQKQITERANLEKAANSNKKLTHSEYGNSWKKNVIFAETPKMGAPVSIPTPPPQPPIPHSATAMSLLIEEKQKTVVDSNEFLGIAPTTQFFIKRNQDNPSFTEFKKQKLATESKDKIALKPGPDGSLPIKQARSVTRKSSILLSQPSNPIQEEKPFKVLPETNRPQTTKSSIVPATRATSGKPKVTFSVNASGVISKNIRPNSSQTSLKVSQSSHFPKMGVRSNYDDDDEIADILREKRTDHDALIASQNQKKMMAIHEKAYQRDQKIKTYQDRKAKLDIAKHDFYFQEYYRKTEDYRKKQGEKEKVRANIVKGLAALFVYVDVELILYTMMIVKKAGPHLVKFAKQMNRKVIVVQRRYRTYRAQKRMRLLTKKQLEALRRMLMRYKFHKQIIRKRAESRRIILKMAYAGLRRKMENRLHVLRGKINKIDAFCEWTYRSMENHLSSLSVLWDKRIVKMPSIKFLNPNTITSERERNDMKNLTTEKLETVMNSTLGPADFDASLRKREILLDSYHFVSFEKYSVISEFLKKYPFKTEDLSFFYDQIEDESKALFNMRVVTSSFGNLMKSKAQGAKLNKLVITDYVKPPPRKIIRYLEDAAILPYTLHRTQMELPVQYRLGTVASLVSQMINEQFVAIDKAIKRRYLLQILKKNYKRYNEALNEYHRQMKMFIDNNKNDINLERIKLLLQTSTEKLLLIHQTDDINEKIKSDSRINHKSAMDSLPYTRMIPLIASKLPGAPQKPRLKLDLDQTTFKACFGKYSEDIKKTFITMIDSTRTGP